MKWSDSINQKPTDLYTHAHTYTTLSEDKQKSILWTYTFHFCLFVLHLESIRLQDQYIIDRVPFISFFKIFFLLFCLVIFFFLLSLYRKMSQSNWEWQEVERVDCGEVYGELSFEWKDGGKKRCKQKMKKEMKTRAVQCVNSSSILGRNQCNWNMRDVARQCQGPRESARDCEGL